MRMPWTRSSGSLGRTQEIILHSHEVSAAIIARQNKAGSDVTAPADRVELSTSAIARLLASDMREELFALMREIFDRHAFAERLAYSPEEAAELLGISRELVHDLQRTGQLGSVKAGRRRLIGKYHLGRFLAGEPP
jgi:excisionase family DNA binding protein